MVMNMRKAGKEKENGRKRGTDRALRLYFKEISQIPLLTIPEEQELGHRARAHDLAARQKMIECNLRFVIKIARKYSRNPEQLLDLINVGNLGLIEAANRFDPDRKVRFTTYAIWWIRQAIFHYLAKSTYAFRVSPKVANILYRAGRIWNSKLGTSQAPTREQLANEVGVSLEELNDAMKVLGGTISLDEPISEEGDLLLSDRLEQTGVPSPEEQMITRSLGRQLDRSIHLLGPVEQMVIRMRFGLSDKPPETLKQIGDRLQLSRERIRQIEARALSKLQNMHTAKALSGYLS